MLSLAPTLSVSTQAEVANENAFLREYNDVALHRSRLVEHPLLELIDERCMFKLRNKSKAFQPFRNRVMILP